MWDSWDAVEAEQNRIDAEWQEQQAKLTEAPHDALEPLQAPATPSTAPETPPTWSEGREGSYVIRPKAPPDGPGLRSLVKYLKRRIEQP